MLKMAPQVHLLVNVWLIQVSHHLRSFLKQHNFLNHTVNSHKSSIFFSFFSNGWFSIMTCLHYKYICIAKACTGKALSTGLSGGW